MTVSNLLPPSEEQQHIINHIKHGKNVIVNAVAGSGKSTTILSIARELPEKRILQITYNSRLRHEIKEKVDLLKFSNISIHTFHSLAVKYYLPSAHTDTELRHILFLKTPIKKPIPDFDILVLDEAQDMSLLYYQFVRKFILDTRHTRLQLLVLGDYHQCLYQFKGADARFLTNAEQIWSFMDVFREPEVKRRGRPSKNTSTMKESNFVQCTLQTSYRITHPIAHFVNRVMLGEERMIACRGGEPVIYIRNSRHNIVKTVVYEIQQLLEAGDKPSDIFVLGGSVRGANSNIRKIENILVENNIPCYIPMFDQDKDDRVVDGKIVFSTFHAVKGRQRKHVFIVGFDQGYFHYIARTADPTVCPNTLYVAATRATHRLYLLEFGQHATDRPLDFLKLGHHEMIDAEYVRFKGTPRILFYKPTDVESSSSKKLVEKKNETPTGLIKFISDSVMDVISPLIDRIFTCKTTRDCLILSDDEMVSVDIPNVVATEYGFEDVSDLNGIALPAMYYDEIQKKYSQGLQQTIDNTNVLYTMIEASLLEMKDNEHQFLKNIVKDLPTVCETIDDYLFLANVYVSIQERLYFKLKQIRRTDYNWLTPKMIELCKSRLDLVLRDECNENLTMPLTEHTIIHHSMEELHEKIDVCLLHHFSGTNLENFRFRFTAIVDLLTEKTLWELKCTTKINIDHQLQVIIYAWLWRITEREPRDFKIFNIKTGEIWVLEASTEDLTTIVVSILKGRYGKTIEKTDEEFLSEIHSLK